MKKVTLFLGVALMTLIMASCGSEKQVASNLPCPECRSTTDVFKYLGQHIASSDRQMQQARSQAANAARSELAAQVSATIQRVVDNYTSEYVTGAESDFRQRLQDLSRTVINQLLVGTPITCEGTMPSTSIQGATICYACVELTGKSVMDEIAKKVSNDEKLRTDFEYEKFKKVLEEEMGKLQ
ncbi:MAG: hypothetical protein IJZ06_04035 [Bacteroidales bacterium]|nr:hypothetical protein [Bacteroidales bacterium]